jgi:hypothetical protein
MNGRTVRRRSERDGAGREQGDGANRAEQGPSVILVGREAELADLIQVKVGSATAAHKEAVRHGHYLPGFSGAIVMRASTLVLATLIGCGSLPALATPCAQQISALQRRLDSIGAVRVAGLEPGHTLTTGSTNALRRYLADKPSDPRVTPTRENVAAARTLMQEAIAEDGEGNQRACENILTDAKRLLGALP